MRNNALNVDILIFVRTPKLQQNKPARTFHNQYKMLSRTSDIIRSSIREALTYTGGSNLMLIMLFSLSMKNVACGISNCVDSLSSVGGSVISILLGAALRLLLR